MDPSEFPANPKLPPNKAKDGEQKSEKKVERVTTGEVSRRSKPLGKRFTETFLQGDTPRGVAQHVVLDVMIPAAQDMVVDAVDEFMQRIFHNESRGARRRNRSGSTSKTNYNKMSQPSYARRDEPFSLSKRARSSHDFDDVLLETRAEAEEVLDNLIELISQYDVATVADLYDMVGVTSDFTDEKWGWTDLRGSGVSRTRQGYLLNLPRPVPLES